MAVGMGVGVFLPPVTIGPKPFGVLKCVWTSSVLEGFWDCPVTIGPKPFGVLKQLGPPWAFIRHLFCHYRAKTLRGTETLSLTFSWLHPIPPSPSGQNPSGTETELPPPPEKPPPKEDVTIGPKPFGVLKQTRVQIERKVGLALVDVSLSGQNPSGY